MPLITIITRKGSFLFEFPLMLSNSKIKDDNTYVCFYGIRHLNGCVIDSISKPTLLITDSQNFLYNQDKRKSRDAKLLGNQNNSLYYNLNL